MGKPSLPLALEILMALTAHHQVWQPNVQPGYCLFRWLFHCALLCELACCNTDGKRV